ncbi:MAG: PQQ-binding-like beta-propeller repeat protein [Gemmataceae bacterium]
MKSRNPLILLCLLMLAALVSAQDALDRVNVTGESSSTARRLAAADRLVADKNWNEAIDELQRIIDEVGNDLVPVERSRRLVEARRLAHLRLSRLPPEILQQYRGKVDARAKSWLERAQSERDPRWLEKIVNQAFCSTSGQRALDLLGDLAFEQGDFDAAEDYWSRLLPAPKGEGDKPRPPSDDDVVRYPDARLDSARVHAKLLLVRIYRGDHDDLKGAIKEYAQQHKEASGKLAGQTGKYVDILEKLASPARQRERQSAASAWPTFAGNFRRNRVLPDVPLRMDRLPLFEPATWTWNLGTQAEKNVRPSIDAPPEARRLAFYPIIVGDVAVSADARVVRFHDLRSGEQQSWDLIEDGKRELPGLALEVPAAPGLAYTLSAQGGFVYARLGCQKLRPRAENDRKGELDSYLVCLRLEPDAGGQRLVWIEEARKTDRQQGVFFEGAPVVYRGRVYVAQSNYDGGAIATSIACFHADTGAACWRVPVEVCSVHDFGQGQARLRQHLLTLAGNRLVYCSHGGAIVALDADDGARIWARRYASRGPTQLSPRELAPCLFASGRIYVAPADYDRILCLEAGNGALVWESEPPVEAVHLLGVAQHRLIFTTPRDIRALDLADGHTLRDWIKPADGVQLAPCGRGLLAGNYVLWPTVHGLRVLDQQTGRVAPFPVNAHANLLRGNLAASDGCLLLADTHQLHAYVAPGRFLEKRRKDMTAAPSPLNQYHLACAEADAGLVEEALGSFAAVEREAPQELRWQEVPLKQLARGRRHQLLLEAAEEALDAARADPFLERAQAADFLPHERLTAYCGRAERWSATDPARAIASWQAVLADPALRSTTSTRPADQLRRGEELARAAIDALIRQQGRAVFARFERKAHALLEKQQFQQLVEQYPNAAAAIPALKGLAERHEKAGRPGAAAQAYRTLSQRTQDMDDMKAARAGLERVLARQLPAAVTPEWQVPLRRVWSVDLARDEKLLPADDPSSSRPQRIFTLRPTDSVVQLNCRDTAAGKVLWKQVVAPPVLWLGHYQDLVLVAGPNAVSAFRLDDGALVWNWQPAAAGWWQTGPQPGVTRVALVDDRLVFLLGERRLVALNAESGEVAWSRLATNADLALPPPAGRFLAQWLATRGRVLVHTASGKRLLLDSRTGRVLDDATTPGATWPAPPHLVDRHQACIVFNRSKLLLIDLDSDAERWSFETVKPSVTGRPPRLFGYGQSLLVVSDAWQLERIDVKTGKSLWQTGGPRWLEDKAPAWDIAVDDKQLYFVRNQAVQALKLEDGKQAWQLPIDGPRGAWRARMVGPHLVVFADPGNFGAPTRGKVQARAGLFSLFFIDPAEGTLRQRLNFETDQPPQFQWLNDTLVVAAGGQLVCLQSAR